MAAVDIGVGHDDDLVISRLIGIEILAANTGTESCDKCADLGGSDHLVEPGALDVKNLAA